MQGPPHQHGAAASFKTNPDERIHPRKVGRKTGHGNAPFFALDHLKQTVIGVLLTARPAFDHGIGAVTDHDINTGIAKCL